MLTKNIVRFLFDYDEKGFLLWKNPPTNRTRIGAKAQSLTCHGYFQTGINRKVHLTHRVIFLYHHGYLPKNIDHINRNRGDNRIENLRDARGFNNANRIKSPSKYSIYKGVTWTKDKKKWKTICQEKHVGYFTNQKDAARAYDERALQVFGEYAHLNFPKTPREK